VTPGADVQAITEEALMPRQAKFRDLGARLVTAFTAVGAITCGIFWAPVWLFSLGTGVWIACGLFEFFTMLKKKGVPVYRVFGIVIGAVIPTVVHFQLGSNRSGEVLFIVLACFGLFILQFSRRDRPYALEGVALTFFGIMYISWFLSFIIKIRYMPSGSVYLAYLLTVTKSGDIAAYVLGTVFGRHTLIPHISPQKSVEGTAGGVFASCLVSLAFAAIFPGRPGLVSLAFLGFLFGIVGLCGDLAESLIKRYAQAKDSGKLLPGLGGVLDAMDSVLFTAPLFYYYLQTW
jgi:phosphatidate cytidylyltransferase